MQKLSWKEDQEIRDWDVDSALTEDRKDVIRNLLALINHQERVIEAYKTVVRELS